MKRRRHTVGDTEFILEPISDAVVKVMHREQVGYFGLRSKDWDPDRPYGWTRYTAMVSDDGVEVLDFFSASNSDAALNGLCEWMLEDQRKADARQINLEERRAAALRVLGEFLEEIPEASAEGPPDPGLSSSPAADGPPVDDEQAREASMDGDRMVTVRLADLCRIADSVAGIMHDQDNGKYKYGRINISNVHEVVEKWASDTSVLGGGCHEHCCRLCREFGGYLPA